MGRRSSMAYVLSQLYILGLTTKRVEQKKFLCPFIQLSKKSKITCTYEKTNKRSEVGDVLSITVSSG